jgi:hypothetical protein
MGRSIFEVLRAVGPVVAPADDDVAAGDGVVLRGWAPEEERDFIAQKAAERFLSAQADTFAGANVKKKRRLAAFEMTCGAGGGLGCGVEEGFVSGPAHRKGLRLYR